MFLEAKPFTLGLLKHTPQLDIQHANSLQKSLGKLTLENRWVSRGTVEVSEFLFAYWYTVVVLTWSETMQLFDNSPYIAIHTNSYAREGVLHYSAVLDKIIFPAYRENGAGVREPRKDWRLIQGSVNKIFARLLFVTFWHSKPWAEPVSTEVAWNWKTMRKTGPIFLTS